MKANRRLRENRKGVAPTLTIILVIPVILMVISAIALWAQNLIITMQNLQDELQEKRELLESLDVGALINSSNIVYSDGFEDSKQDDPQWNTNNKLGASALVVGSETEANQSYYSGHLGGYINLGYNNNALSSITKSFKEKCYGLVSIELAFTVSSLEKHKTFSIYENDDKNYGSIKIDIKNEKVYYYSNDDFQEFFGNPKVCLFANKLCWHTMKLLVNFSSLKYVNFTLDGVTYDLKNVDLNKADAIISKSPETITVSYACVRSDKDPVIKSESWIDDFVFCNLDPFYNLNIKWV